MVPVSTMNSHQVLWISALAELPADWPRHSSIEAIDLATAEEGLDALGDTDYAAIVLVNPVPGSGPLQLSATVVRDRPRQVSLVDPDGKPVVGVKMQKMSQWTAFRGDTPVASVQKQVTTPRAASFPLTGLHPDRNQVRVGALSAEITFSQPEPPTSTPTATETPEPPTSTATVINRNRACIKA